MAHLYILGGFCLKRDTKPLEIYISNELNIKDLNSVWLDPQNESRAVFSCSQKIDINEILVLIETKTLNNKTLYVGEEKGTDLLYVDVGSIECKALIDKLPWVFHEREKGGSKVSHIEKIKENIFKLTFKEGWDAVMNVLKSSWSVNDVQVKVTPFFSSFEEDYEKQKQRCQLAQITKLKPGCVNKDAAAQAQTLSLPSRSSSGNASQTVTGNKPVKKPAKKTKSKDIYLINAAHCVLLKCLSLSAKAKEKYPDVNLNVNDDMISIKGPASLMTKIDSMIHYESTVIEEHWREEFSLFLDRSNQEGLLRHFHDHRIILHLEDNKDEEKLELFVQRDNETISLQEFLSSEIRCVHEIANVPKKEKEIYNDYLSEFNAKHAQYKLDSTQMNTWKLFYFGTYVDDEERSNILEEIRRFLKGEAEPKGNVWKPNEDKSDALQKPKPVKLPKSRTENLPLQSELLVLLSCLSFDKIIQQQCSVTVRFAEDYEMISLRGKSPDLEKLKALLITLQEVLTSKEHIKELSLFFNNSNQENLQKHFQDSRIILQMEEEEEEETFQLFVQEDQVTISLQQFLSLGIKCVHEQHLKKRNEIYNDYLSEFNAKHAQYKLDATQMNTWKLFYFGTSVNDEELSNIVEEIERFFTGEAEPIGNVGKPNEDKSDALEKAKPVKPPKSRTENLMLRPDFLVLLNCWTLDKKIQEIYSTVTVEFNTDADMISLKGKAADVEKLKFMLLSLQEDFTSKIDSAKEREIEKLLACRDVQELVKTDFKFLLEPSGEALDVFIQDKDDKKGSLQIFTTKVLNRVKVFPLMDKDEGEQESFNHHHPMHRLIKCDDQWIQFKRIYADDNNDINSIKMPLSTDEGSEDEFVDCEEDFDIETTPAYSAVAGAANYLETHRQRNHAEKRNTPKVDLKPFVAKYLIIPSNLQSMKLKMSKDTWNLQILGLSLTFSTRSFRHSYNEIGDYLKQIKSDSINLPYVRVKEFYGSDEGRQLFSCIEKKHACAILPSDAHMGGGPSNDKQEETKYRLTPLSTTQFGKLSFHVTQGDSRNLQNLNGSIFICPSGAPHNEEHDNTRIVYLKHSPRNDNELQMAKELNTRLREFEQRDFHHICISVSSKCFERVSYDLITQLIIKETKEVFDYGRSVHIFLCEASSVPLLKAFQYNLTDSTVINLPTDYNWKSLSPYVTGPSSKPDYPDSVKFEVTFSVDQHASSKSIACYPIESPLEFETSPLKNEFNKYTERYYDDALNALEKERPDGLCVGEVFEFKKSPLRYCDVAVYGCQAWGYDVKKAIQQTVKNCMSILDSPISDWDSMYIVIPGTTQQCSYPKEWIVSKWFEYLDSWIDKHRAFKGTIYFVVPNHQCNTLFKDYLMRRTQKKGMWKTITGKVFNSGTKSHPTSSKTEDNFIVVNQGSSVHKKVEKALKDEMTKLLQKNERSRDLTPREYECVKKEITDNKLFQVSHTGKNKKKKHKLTATALMKSSVDDAWNVLNALLDSSSVDPYEPERDNPRVKERGQHLNQYEKEREEKIQNEENEELKVAIANSLDDKRNDENWNRGGGRGGQVDTSKDTLVKSVAGSSNRKKDLVTNDDNEGSREKRGREEATNEETLVKSVADNDSSNSSSSNSSSSNKGHFSNDETELKGGKRGIEKASDEETLVKSVADGSNSSSSSNKGGMTHDKELNGGAQGGMGARAKATPGKTVHAGHTDTVSDGALCFLPSPEHFQWFYYDAGKGRFFDDDDDEDEDDKNCQLETDYRQMKASSVVDHLSINLSTMIGTSGDTLTGPFFVGRCEIFQDKDVACPEDWTIHETLTKLKKRDSDYKEIEEAFRDYDNLSILKIERIQNRKRFGKFIMKKKKLKCTPNETVMWQRIDDDSLKQAVIEYGCQKAFFGLKCNELGDGICFASNINDCVDEWDIKNAKKMTLVRCSVHLGVEGKGEGCPGIRYPPINKSSDKPFSSVSNDQFSMVFFDAQAYPTHFVQVTASDDE